MSDDWRHEALCRVLVTDGALTEREASAVFFPPSQERGQSYRDVGWSPDAALAVCAQCPVAEECLSDALAHRERVGVRGGVDLGDATRRRAALRRRPLVRCRWCDRTFQRDPESGLLHYCSERHAALARQAQQRSSNQRRTERAS